MTSADPGPARSARGLPWSLLWRIVLSWAALLGPVTYLYGPAYGGVTALVGLVPGFAGHVIGHRRIAHLASLSLLCGVGVLAVWSGLETLWLGAGVLILAAGLEAYRAGGRAFVLALYGWCALALVPTLPDSGTAFPFVALGLIWGSLCARLLGMSGQTAIPPISARLSASLAVFLLAGAILSAELTQVLDAEYGYWVVLLFVMRALSPPEKGVEQAIIYGIGAAGGSALALAVAYLGLPAVAKLVLAFGLTIAGLRYLPHPGPVSAAAFTASVLLILPVGVDGVVLRAEAAALAVTLAIGLIVVIGLGWSLIWRAVGTREDKTLNQNPLTEPSARPQTGS